MSEIDSNNAIFQTVRLNNGSSSRDKAKFGKQISPLPHPSCSTSINDTQSVSSQLRNDRYPSRLYTLFLVVRSLRNSKYLHVYECVTCQMGYFHSENVQSGKTIDLSFKLISSIPRLTGNKRVILLTRTLNCFTAFHPEGGGFPFFSFLSNIVIVVYFVWRLFSYSRVYCRDVFSPSVYPSVWPLGTLGIQNKNWPKPKVCLFPIDNVALARDSQDARFIYRPTEVPSRALCLFTTDTYFPVII